MTDKQAPSTLQSYVDSASGAVQSAIGSLTGNTGDEVKGDAKQEAAKAEHLASQAHAKVGGTTITADGGIAQDHADRTTGSWNQTLGSAKEALGGLVGSESLKSAGREQNLQGQQQEAKGQLQDLASGIGGRLQGTIGGAITGLTGDEKGQAHYDQMRADGKAQQRGVEADLQKKAEAEADAAKEEAS